MGVTYKKLGELGRAVHCFMHSLELRPNHPEALLSFFSLFPSEEKLVLFGAARVFAIGGRDALDGVHLLLDAVEFHSEEFARFSAFERGLERAEAPPQAPGEPTLHKHNGHNGHNGHNADHWLEALALRKKSSS